MTSRPEYVTCGNPACDHRLRVVDYEGFCPREDTEPERVHRIIRGNDPFSVLCSCGHYTIVGPPEGDG